ncbi:MAG: phage major capsid domain-containing protein, partial [Candidatus Fonsibacter sp.]
MSQSTSNHVYNVAVPTLETIISREVLWKSTVTLKVTTEGRTHGTFAMNYGVTDALAPFPLHSLVNVMSATINNNTVSFNVQETLPLLLR